MPYLKADYTVDLNGASSNRFNSCTHVPSKANQNLNARLFKLGPRVFAFSVCSGVFFYLCSSSSSELTLFFFFFRTHTLVNYTLVAIEHNNKTHLILYKTCHIIRLIDLNLNAASARTPPKAPKRHDFNNCG